MEEPLSPREFLRRYHLPQLVRINEAHLHQLNKSRIGSGATATGDQQTRTRSLDSNGTTITSGSTASSSCHKIQGNHTIGHRGPVRHHLTDEDIVQQMMMPSKQPMSKSKSHSKASKLMSNKSQTPQQQQTMLDGQILDLDQPFLLYKAYSCRQVIATTLAPDASNDPANYRRAGPSLLIPESYTVRYSQKYDLVVDQYQALVAAAATASSTSTCVLLSRTIKMLERDLHIGSEKILRLGTRNGRNWQDLVEVSIILEEQHRYLLMISRPNLFSDIGKWEMHTKGIGAKLLKLSGFEQGEGLGKFKQGMPFPILDLVGNPGWFAMITSKGHTAGYFSTIDEVARAQVPYFLTRDNITGFKAPDTNSTTSHNNNNHNGHKSSSSASSSSASNFNYDKSVIKGGSVLQFLGVYEDISSFIFGKHFKNCSLRSRKAAAAILEPHGERYAKIVSFANNAAGEVIFVPITEIGRFYVIAKTTRSRSKNRNSSSSKQHNNRDYYHHQSNHHNTSRDGQQLSYNHVYSLNSILKCIKLPAVVQLVVGPKPRNHHNATSLVAQQLFGSAGDSQNGTFSEVLRLEEIRVRDIILASTIRPQPFSMGGDCAMDAVSSRRHKSITSSIRRTLRGARFGSEKSSEPVLLEFDLDSSFTFIRTFVERNGTLTSRKIPELVVQRLAYCHRESDLWKRQIKIAHDIIPRSGAGGHTSDSGCSSGDASPTHTQQKLKRPSLFDHEEFKKNFNSKNASIGSRTSSNASNSSRISKILHRFWNPLRRKHRDDEFSEIEEDVSETDDELTATESIADNLDRKLSSSKKQLASTTSVNKIGGDDEYHFYETLKRVDEAKFYPPKQRLSRKATLDVIFPNLVNIDDNGYILSASQKKGSVEHVDDSIYSTLG